jgi:hypothetical protein
MLKGTLERQLRCALDRSTCMVYSAICPGKARALSVFFIANSSTLKEAAFSSAARFYKRNYV